jgi:anaerobic magnesium-protoporphyrin IX monomethyl ester cyclase
MTPMKIQLIYPPTSRRGGNPDWAYPPLGLLYLAAYARRNNPDIEWKVSDGQMDGEVKCLADFRSFKPDLVGISFATPHAAGAYQFIDKLREESPDILIVCGGAHPSALPEEVLSRTSTDIVVVGEGEVAFASIVEDFSRGIIKPGYKKILTFPLIKDIDSIPFPARDLINFKRYPGWVFSKRGAGTHFTSSRGCPYNCRFCSNPVWKAQKPWCRLRSPQNVVDEIQLLREKYGIREFFDQCDEFNINTRHAIEICDEILQRGLDIKWKVQMTARVKHLSEELIEKMAKSGCWLVCLGLESGNQATLNGIGKAISIEEIRHACGLLKKHGIRVLGLFMMFNIWEENGELRYEGVEESLNTIRFAKSLRDKKLLDYLSCTITTPFPASPLWDIAIKYNLVSEKDIGRWQLWDSSWNQAIKLPTVSEEDWRKTRAMGGRLQSYSVLSRLRDVNLAALPTLMRRGTRVLKLMIKPG